MTVTALDRKTARIIVDLQKRLVSLPGGLDPMEHVVRHACIVAAAFRRIGKSGTTREIIDLVTRSAQS